MARRKLSTGKVTWPDRKQVWRRYDADARMAGDVLSVEDDEIQGAKLLVPVMRGGHRQVRRRLFRCPRPCAP